MQEAAPDVEAADDFAGRLPDGVILLMYVCACATCACSQRARQLNRKSYVVY